MKKIISRIRLGDMVAVYCMSEEKQAELLLLPQEKESLLRLKGNVDSLVQLKREEDAYPFGFANGHTMRNSETVYGLQYVSQNISDENGCIRVVTQLEHPTGLTVFHVLEYNKRYPVVTIYTELENHGDKEEVIQMLSSFSLAGLTPFAQDEATGQLMLHRLRSKWSNEGRVETRTIEELQLEPTWSRWGAFSEKYGEIGSMPVRHYFPFAAVEDTTQHVVWAMELSCASSWQMEIYRRDENLCVSGGIADEDFGHWSKTLMPGESFRTPPAYVTAAAGDFDSVCQRLTSIQRKLMLARRPERLPVVFNEFCTTWGNPGSESIDRILKALRQRDIDYFVIDAGWHADENGWEFNMGDWQVSEKLFPNGLEEAVEHIRSAGMKPGIWFEMEVIGKDALAWAQTDHMLTRNGKVIRAGNRRFWDMRDPWTINYLKERLIGFLSKYGFSYLKVDYNESIGVGCDGAESIGEGLRQSIEASRSFLRMIREELPELVIEMCASGGNRLEPSMTQLADFLSFSDAHEEPEIPVIAANLHRAVLPEQSQIWAVLRKRDSLRRIVYSLTAAMHGVMCLSGDVFDLDQKQWEKIDEGIGFYRKISHVIRDGETEFFGVPQMSYRKLENWQATVRYSTDGKEALVLLHVFAIDRPVTITLPVRRSMKVRDVYESCRHTVRAEGNKLHVKVSDSFEALALFLRTE